MSRKRNSPQQCILTEISCGGALSNYPLGSSPLQPLSLAASPLPHSTCTGMMDHYRIADARALELSSPSSSSSKWQMIPGSRSNKWPHSPNRSSMPRSPALETISVAYSQVFDNLNGNTTYNTSAPGGPTQFMDGSGGYPAAAAGVVCMLSGESSHGYELPAASPSLGSTAAAAAAVLSSSTNSFHSWDPLTREEEQRRRRQHHHYDSTLSLPVDPSNGGFVLQGRGGGGGAPTVAPPRSTSAASQSLTRFAAANLGGFADRAMRFTTVGSGSPSSPSPVSPSFLFSANGNAGSASLFDHHNDGTSTSSNFAKAPGPGPGIASRSTTASELGPELISASRISASPYGHDRINTGPPTEARGGPLEIGRIETIIRSRRRSSEPPSSTSRGPGFASPSGSAACCSNADHHHPLDHHNNNNNKVRAGVKEQRENAACPREEEKLVTSDSDASDLSRGRGRHDSPSGVHEVAPDPGSSTTPMLTPATPSSTGIAGRKRRSSPTEPSLSRGKTAISPTSKNPTDSSSGSSKRFKDGSGSGSGRAVPTSEAPRSPVCVGEPSGSSNSQLPTSKEASASKNNNSVDPKLDYIHVRARRGQATDSHSLAERVRREKISERMKYLQDLVPGCSKITGKALMLDEIINYVQSIQRQVEFLSMKLASITPSPEFSIDNILSSQQQPQIQIEAAYRHTDAEMREHSAPSLPFGHAQAQQAVQVPRRSIPHNFDFQTPVSIQRTLPEEFTIDVGRSQASSNWDGDLHSVVQLGLLGQHKHGQGPSGNPNDHQFHSDHRSMGE